ncbi:cytochrome P450 [Streptomyces bohaiensis]|uniref:Cytochrome P450 n=1 Tax=Streptomyces bohaiensis TaxID=1431344 RepID=A0ABX1C5F2_9ACTN|nr:cytochrome P450 [Streptomyces bohaiensis]NJQ14432.1 cytochrome P450 [Streptomyces bohaiensis]
MSTIHPPTAPAGRPLPEIPGAPLIGHARALRRDLLGLVGHIARESPGIAGFRIAHQRAAVASSPETVREVLIERAADFDKGERQVRAITPVMGRGLLISEGDLHARQRKLILPHFTPRRIARHADAVVAEAEHALAGWSEDTEVDLLDEMNTLTMNIVSRLLFSTRIRDDRALAEAITGVFEWEMHALTRLVVLPLSVPTPRNLRARTRIDYIRGRIDAFIQERRSADDPVQDLLTVLMNARYEDGAVMDDRQLLDETLTIWGASQETSADAQTWALYLLARHPEAHARVREEVDRVLGGRPATFEDLKQLPYSLQVFKEAMRLYPPAAVMLRTAVRDTVIGGCRIARGTMIFLAIHTLHRSPDLYPEPERFDPDRFTKEREHALPRQAYLPFGTGKHVCVGSHLALMEGQLLTATMTQRLDVELLPQPPVEPLLLINLRPRDGVRARVRHRTAPAR